MSITEDKTSTLRAESHQHEPIVLSFQERAGKNHDGILIQEDHIGAMRSSYNQSVLDDRNLSKEKSSTIFGEDITPTLIARCATAVGNTQDGLIVAEPDILQKVNCVRRLTPMECERLQGYPDGWTDIPGATDSKRYKALGNSIALPFWEHLAKRFVEIGKVQNIGSLFDGIGGFPLVFQRAGAETKWTSEIEPFCEDVVRYHVESEDLW